MKTVLAYLPASLGLVALVIGLLYCLQNTSGHSGVNPIQASLGFLPILGIGIFLLCKPTWRRAGWVTTVIGVFGLGFGSFVSKLQIMQGYETWLKSGQESSESSIPLLLVFVIFLFVSLGAAVWMTRVRQNIPASGSQV